MKNVDPKPAPVISETYLEHMYPPIILFLLTDS